MLRKTLTGAFALTIAMLALAPAAEARGGFTHVGPRGVTHGHWNGRGGAGRHVGWNHGHWHGRRFAGGYRRYGWGAGAVAAGAAVGIAATRAAHTYSCGPYPYDAGPYCYPY